MKKQDFKEMLHRKLSSENAQNSLDKAVAVINLSNEELYDFIEIYYLLCLDDFLKLYMRITGEFCYKILALMFLCASLHYWRELCCYYLCKIDPIKSE